MRSDTEPNGNEMRSDFEGNVLKAWPILTTGLVAIPGAAL